MPNNKVILRVYNLGSEAHLKTLSLLLQKEISGLFHTALEVYDTEYFFHQSITKATPNSTIFGNPIRMHQLGETQWTQEEIEEYLEILSDKYNSESYHLLLNNCNNFTNCLSLFLVGQSIPAYILEAQEQAASNEIVCKFVEMMYNNKGV